MYRVAAEFTLPAGPARLVVQQGFTCAENFTFSECSCLGGHQLDIACANEQGTVALSAGGDLRWKRPAWSGTNGGCCLTRSDDLPVP